MINCPECKWNYPSNTYLSQFMLSGRRFAVVCGICALELGNKLHGIPRTEFLGEQAEEMRQKAVRWRQNNPKYGPPEGTNGQS